MWLLSTPLTPLIVLYHVLLLVLKLGFKFILGFIYLLIHVYIYSVFIDIYGR